MPISGKIIVINSQDQALARQIALDVRDQEKHLAYIHIGYSTLKTHFANSDNDNKLLELLPALFAAISASARTGADIIVDLSLNDLSHYQQFKQFTRDLDVVWVDVGESQLNCPTDLTLSDTLPLTDYYQHISELLNKRYLDVESFARWVPEISPIPEAKNKGAIILVHGAPSSGKSTLSRTIQRLSTDTFLHVGVDTAVLNYLHLRYLIGVPLDEQDQSWREPNFNPSEYHKQGGSWIAPGPNKLNATPHMRFQLGMPMRRAFSAMYATMAEMSRLGFNVISDHCFHFENQYAEALHRFKDLPVIYVALDPSIETLQQREIARGDRMIGMAEAIHHQMKRDFDADLRIDTGKVLPETAAEQILQLYDHI